MLIPSQASDIVKSWMEGALADHLGGARIEQVEARRLIDPGQTSEAIDIAVRYNDDSCTLPKRYIAKLGSNDPDVIAMCDLFGHYPREVLFYQSFPDAGIPKPKCFYSACSDDGLQMVLLLEHLAPAQCPSWNPRLDQIDLALSYLPAFHGKWWNAPELKTHKALVPISDRVLSDGFAGAAAGAEEILSVYGKTAEIAVACIVTVSEKMERWRSYMASRNLTMIHGDYHGKQMFMPGDEGGRFAVIDWQYPFLAEGAWDLARLLGICLSFSDWKNHLDRIINGYHGGLQEMGVSNYSKADLRDGIRMGLVVSAVIQSIAQLSTDMTKIARECEGFGLDWQEVWLGRHNRMMIDLDVEAFVRGI
ncbi:MAG: DUF1679 domain-containing protein [Proteobacteria bacterium]|nr:DUF1679 domain-containing protein [Pseudomonadota bacterium]MDA0914563.1 DUF1679 domain-containing protein [Pseudomonadota bacterium]MDA1033546.1 DUF1679 domain-containing protein [Pseudomonadota bacterium]